MTTEIDRRLIDDALEKLKRAKLTLYPPFYQPPKWCVELYSMIFDDAIREIIRLRTLIVASSRPNIDEEAKRIMEINELVREKEEAWLS